jgi:hypothetical protein
MSYRIRKKPISSTEMAYGITEVYRMVNGNTGWVETWMAPTAIVAPDDPDADVKAATELRRQLTGMLHALDQPVLDDSGPLEQPHAK